MAKTAVWAVAITMMATALFAEDLRPDVRGHHPAEPARVILVENEESPFLAMLPIPLPTYRVFVREVDHSVLLAFEYIPELWLTREGQGRFDLCFDVAPSTPHSVDPEPPLGRNPADLLMNALSNAMNRLATVTKVGFAVSYSFNS